MSASMKSALHDAKAVVVRKMEKGRKNFKRMFSRKYLSGRKYKGQYNLLLKSCDTFRALIPRNVMKLHNKVFIQFSLNIRLEGFLNCRINLSHTKLAAKSFKIQKLPE